MTNFRHQGMHTQKMKYKEIGVFRTTVYRVKSSQKFMWSLNKSILIFAAAATQSKGLLHYIYLTNDMASQSL
jgi:hypothetical protein